MLQMSKEELYTRGGILDKMMQNCFDMAVLVDADCKIIYSGNTKYSVLSEPEKMVGRSISLLDNVSPFKEVIQTGKAITGLLLEINGRKSISNIFPVMCGGEVLGALGVVLFHNIATIKKIFAEVQSGSNHAWAGEIYQNIALMSDEYTFDDFIGNSPAVTELIGQCKKAAQSRYPILIIGETGTGKEIISASIHAARNLQKFSPYVTINCTAIPENLLESELFGYEKGAFTGAAQRKIGKFEQAGHGDILLDEIGDMSLALQGKMLRVLESKEFERVGGRTLIPFQAGVIAATNKNLVRHSQEGLFRADLYYRLSVIELFIPPLRSRTEDIPLLLDYFMRGKQAKIRLTQDACELLQRYPWPGNVRQLKNLINRLLVLYDGAQVHGDTVLRELTAGQENYDVTLGDSFSPQKMNPKSGVSKLKETERDAIIKALHLCKHNMAETARKLGISRATLYKKINEYKI